MVKDLFLSFKEKVMDTFGSDQIESTHDIDNLIAMGVLMWIVASADDNFLPAEQDKIEEVLREYSDITDKDMPIVLRAIEEAAISRIDTYSFTECVGGDLPYEAKQEIVENLFHVAGSDGEIDHVEHESIRKISGLLRLDHKDFINAKKKVKDQLNLD